jgi:hypothetical protein
LGKVTDINEFRRAKDINNSTHDTDGSYLTIVIGETLDGEDIILINQCEVEGNTKHKDTITMDKDMLHILIDELIVAVSIIEDKESK